MPCSRRLTASAALPLSARRRLAFGCQRLFTMCYMFHCCGDKLEVNTVMSQLTILIGGATGFVGSQLVAHLSAHYPQVQVRALTRTPESDTARHFAALPGVTVVRGNYGDVQSLEAAAEGADRAYVACNNVAEQRRLECNFIDACKGQGVRRIAKISTFRSLCRADGPGHGAAHYHIAQHLHHSGVAACDPPPRLLFPEPPLLRAAHQDGGDSPPIAGGHAAQYGRLSRCGTVCRRLVDV